MPRRLRIEYEGAIYHVMSRGNARQDIVHDDDDRRRLLDDLERVVTRCGWEVPCFVVMTNHLHLLVKTPRPNLSRGMQNFLSAYAQWCQRRRGRPGHLLQGRYKAEMIEDETYYWTVSRYIHLNPVRAKLVEHPSQWAWSSYQGYAQRSSRLPWVAYDALLGAWRGEYGGSDASEAYQGFVEAGVGDPPSSPFREAFDGWVLGSGRFVDRLRALHGPASSEPPDRESRELPGLSVELICLAVAEHYGVSPSELSCRGAIEARAAAAWLCRRYTEASLRDLAGPLGLSRGGSVSNLTRRVDARVAESAKFAEELVEIVRKATGGR